MRRTERREIERNRWRERGKIYIRGRRTVGNINLHETGKYTYTYTAHNKIWQNMMNES